MQTTLHLESGDLGSSVAQSLIICVIWSCSVGFFRSLSLSLFSVCIKGIVNNFIIHIPNMNLDPYLTLCTKISFQFSSVAQSCPTLCDPMNRSTPGLLVHHHLTISWSSIRLTSIESMRPSSHLILGHPLLLLPPIPLSIRVFSNESALRMRRPKYWSFSFSIIPSKEIPGLISFRMDWLDLLAVQGTLKSLLPTPQFKSINSSALSFLHSPTLTSIHDHRKNHSLD